MINEKEIIGEGKYAVGKHQQFVDRTGKLVRAVKGSANPVPVGEAYAFFNCSASRDEMGREIPKIRSLAQTPSELEIYLTEGKDSLNGDVELRQIADEAREKGIRYVMRANYPNGTNAQTADELAGILNQAYQSPLFKEDEQFVGKIFYKQGNQYVSRD